AELPSDRVIDGHDIWPLLAGEPGARSAYQSFFYYRTGELRAVRAGKWKLHVPHTYRTTEGGEVGEDGQPGRYAYTEIGLAL
ncbi:MAG: arylsulfatase, partial [Gemmatimonadetes bacterium]|nr:arylsulfatase [Gemmatimonadota bacterium]NIW75116.1 arylsulfatase [Gemmatimonadota bacterium]